ncbi:MAG: hypothetical protein OEW22_03360 [Rubrivivax sp.]|nr:hypothetical protein [Rubrivivax sp.]
MRPPPAVSLSCEDGGLWRRIQGALAGLTAMVLARWVLALGAWPPAPAWWLALAAGSLAATAVWFQVGGTSRRLSWDGARWQLLGQGAGAALPMSQVRVAIDTGGWMLLRCTPAGGGPTHWLAAGAVQVAAARPALYACDGRTDPGPADGPASGPPPGPWA